MLLGAEHFNCNTEAKKQAEILKMKRDVLLSLGDYEIHHAREGFSSIRQISSREIMHSRTDPMDEARKLYVEQSHLTERLREESRNEDPVGA